MNKEVTNRCANATNKIVNIVEGMGFTTEKRLAKGELNALVFIEVRRLINDVVTDFYKNAALVPVESELIDAGGEPVVIDDSSLNDPSINADQFAP